MARQTIQGFFLGGAMRAPAEGARPVVARRIVPAARIGSPKPTQGWPAPLHQKARPLQRFGGDGSFEIDPSQVGLARSGGRPLPQALLTKMEAAFGADFSAVRVHVGPQAARIGAIAFTTGNDLYFAPGRFQPDSIQGQQLIGHELAHVVQQRQGRVCAPGSGVAVVQDHALEAEADRLGMRAAAHHVPIQAKMAAASAPRAMAVRMSVPIADGRGGYRLSAGVGGQEVGSVRLHPGGGSTIEVTDLGVNLGYRDHGVGKQLLARAARMGMQLGKSKVSLAAQDDGSGRLTRWYKSMGFAQTGVNERGMAKLESSAGHLVAATARGTVQQKSADMQARTFNPRPPSRALQPAWALGANAAVRAPLNAMQQARARAAIAAARARAAAAVAAAEDQAALAAILAFIGPNNVMHDGGHRRENYFMRRRWPLARLRRVRALWNALGAGYHSYAPNAQHRRQFHFLRPTVGRAGYNDNVHVFHN